MGRLGRGMVHPWGVEPQSSEPESDILSIELRVPIFAFLCCKFTKFFVVLQIKDRVTPESLITIMNVRIDKTWHEALAEEWEKPYFSELASFVHQEYGSGVVYPPAKQIFAAFDACPFDDVKVVILGQDPYHGPGQANGLCFSVADDVAMPPSLINIFKEVHADTGAPMPANGNLSRWAEQGVLLLNATLTVRAHTAGSHQGHGWEELTDAAIRALNDRRSGIVFILWGAYAARKGQFIDTSRHLVLKSPHPSPLSASRGFFGNHHFTRANDYIVAQGKAPIQW